MSGSTSIPIHYSVSWQCDLVPVVEAAPHGVGRARVVVRFDSMPDSAQMDVRGEVTGEVDLMGLAKLPIHDGVCRAWTPTPGGLTVELRLPVDVPDGRPTEVRVRPQREECGEPNGMEPGWFELWRDGRLAARGPIELFLRHFLIRAVEAD